MLGSEVDVGAGDVELVGLAVVQVTSGVVVADGLAAGDSLADGLGSIDGVAVGDDVAQTGPGDGAGDEEWRSTGPPPVVNPPWWVALDVG